MTKSSLFDDWPSDFEAQFWSQYPLRVSKVYAMKCLEKVRARGDVPWAILMAGVARYAAYTARRGDPNFIKHPSTWLNQGCWDDEYPTPEPPKPSAFEAFYRRDH